MNYRNYQPILSTFHRLGSRKCGRYHIGSIRRLAVDVKNAGNDDPTTKFSITTSGILAGYAFEAYNDPTYGKKAIGLDNTLITYKSLNFIKHTFDGLLSVNVKEIQLHLTGNPLIAKLLAAEKLPEFAKLFSVDKPPEYFVNIIPHEHFLHDIPNPTLRVVDHLNYAFRVKEQKDQCIVALPEESKYSKTGSNNSVYIRSDAYGAVEINVVGNAFIGEDKMLSKIYLPLPMLRNASWNGEEVKIPLYLDAEHRVITVEDIVTSTTIPTTSQSASEKTSRSWLSWSNHDAKEKLAPWYSKKARLHAIGHITLTLHYHAFNHLPDPQIAALVHLPPATPPQDTTPSSPQHNHVYRPYECIMYPDGAVPDQLHWSTFLQSILTSYTSYTNNHNNNNNSSNNSEESSFTSKATSWLKSSLQKLQQGNKNVLQQEEYDQIPQRIRNEFTASSTNSSSSSRSSSGSNSLLSTLATDGPLWQLCHIDNLDTDTQCTVWYHPSKPTALVSFRGTEIARTKDIITDIQVLQREYCLAAQETLAIHHFKQFQSFMEVLSELQTQRETLEAVENTKKQVQRRDGGDGGGESGAPLFTAVRQEATRVWTEYARRREAEKEKRIRRAEVLHHGNHHVAMEGARVHEGFVTAYQSIQVPLVQQLCYLAQLPTDTVRVRDIDKISDTFSDKVSDKVSDKGGHRLRPGHGQRQGGELYITGHSLGGALATVCSFDLARLHAGYFTRCPPSIMTFTHTYPTTTTTTTTTSSTTSSTTNNSSTNKQQQEKHQKTEPVLLSSTSTDYLTSMLKKKEALLAQLDTLSDAFHALPATASSLITPAALRRQHIFSAKASTRGKRGKGGKNEAITSPVEAMDRSTLSNTTLSSSASMTAVYPQNILPLSYYLTTFHDYLHPPPSTSSDPTTAPTNPSDVSLLVYTYGTPRLGNAQFQSLYNTLLPRSAYRVVNQEDIIARLPMRMSTTSTNRTTVTKKKTKKSISFMEKTRNSLSMMPDYYHVGKTVLIGNTAINAILQQYTQSPPPPHNTMKEKEEKKEGKAGGKVVEKEEKKEGKVVEKGEKKEGKAGEMFLWIEGETIAVCPLDHQALVGLDMILFEDEFFSFSFPTLPLRTTTSLSSLSTTFTNTLTRYARQGTMQYFLTKSETNRTIAILLPLLTFLHDLFPLPEEDTAYTTSNTTSTTSQQPMSSEQLSTDQMKQLLYAIYQDIQQLDEIQRMKEQVFSATFLSSYLTTTPNTPSTPTTTTTTTPSTTTTASTTSTPTTTTSASASATTVSTTASTTATTTGSGAATATTDTSSLTKEYLQRLYTVLRDEQRLDTSLLLDYLTVTASTVGVDPTLLDVQVQRMVNKVALVTHHLEPSYHQSLVEMILPALPPALPPATGRKSSS